ncbi:siderophore-interacting protein [Nocardia xishanensis]|uniref:siderophore-interacting protein n=1 Tax=Nocardia xishanensis TaxID=238964 RepID=UPI0034416614
MDLRYDLEADRRHLEAELRIRLHHRQLRRPGLLTEFTHGSAPATAGADVETGKLQHRGYTLVDPDPQGDRFAIEFALHDGPAARWAVGASVGDGLDATVLGSSFELPEATPSEYLVFGDTASLPAINSLLDAIGDAPARVWLEWQYESDQTLPVRNKPHHQVTWLQRVDDGRLLREQSQEISCAADAFAWVACDGHTTRSIVKTLRTSHNLPKTAIKSQAYWK